MTKKKKPDNEFALFMSKLIKVIGIQIKKHLDKKKKEYDIKKKFNKEIKINIKKNQMYAKGKNAKRHSLTDNGGGLY